MASTFDVIASAEDGAYMAWQCKLLHYSCVTTLGAEALLFVHGFRAEARVPRYRIPTTLCVCTLNRHRGCARQ